MKALKNIFRIALYNIKRWRANYRIWFIAVYVLFLIYDLMQNLPAGCELSGEKAGPWLLTLLLSSNRSFRIFAIPFIILFCDAPFLDKTQPYIIIRSKRCIWAWGQIVYIVISSFLYSLYLTLAVIVINLRYIEFTGGWGTLIEDPYANDFLVKAGSKGAFYIPEEVVRYFEPIQSTFCSFLLFWLAGILIGLLIFCLNSITSSRVIGTAVAAFQVILAGISYNYPNYYKFSPISWAVLRTVIDERDFWRFTSPAAIAAAYFAIFAVLITVIMIHNRRRTIEVLPPI